MSHYNIVCSRFRIVGGRRVDEEWAVVDNRTYEVAHDHLRHDEAAWVRDGLNAGSGPKMELARRVLRGRESSPEPPGDESAP